MSIRPTKDRHYVAIDEPETKVGLIHLPTDTAEPKFTGTILEAGENSEGLAKGKKILFHNYVGHQVEGERGEGGTAMLDTDDILAIIEEDGE